MFRKKPKSQSPIQKKSGQEKNTPYGPNSHSMIKRKLLREEKNTSQINDKTAKEIASIIKDLLKDTRP